MPGATPIPRTPDAIKRRVELIKNDDFFGAETGRLVMGVEYKVAKRFDWVDEEHATPESWNAAATLFEEDVEAAIVKYLPFAWGKANGRRGLSASRSVSHFSGLLWLLGDEHFDEFRAVRYEYYGKAHLVRVSELFMFPWREHDDGRWANDELAEGVSSYKAVGIA